MSFAPIPEYEGKSPYVFISYAQQDEKIAYAVAVKMYNEGFRIWSSAACGNPSNMRIAERLSNSAVAVVFLSKSYIKYASYNEFEPRIVMSNPKKKIVICLDDTPLGTDWNTVDFPAGIRYNPDFPQEMWLKINSSDTLEQCRGAWPNKPMPLPFEDAPTVKVSVDSLDENELAGELSSLNSVMSSFGAGLDDDEISNITLFQKKRDSSRKLSWNEHPDPSQEQEYYAIENLIASANVPAEKKQYDSMVGLIENFMGNNAAPHSDVNVEKASQNLPGNSYAPRVYAPVDGDYTAVPLNKFNSVDMTSASKKPVLFTESSEDAHEYGNTAAYSSRGFTPLAVNYGDGDEFGDEQRNGYTMTRTASRADRFIYTPLRNDTIDNGFEPMPELKPSEVKPSLDKKVSLDKLDKSAAVNEPLKKTEVEGFEKIVDDRKLMTTTEDTMDQAKLTYHLGILDSFNESDYIDSPTMPIEAEKSAEPDHEKTAAVETDIFEMPKHEPVDNTPVRFADDFIPPPALSFEKPKPADPEPKAVEPPIVSQRSHTVRLPRRLRAGVSKRWRVGVRMRINHIEYGDEMYKVNGRWIPGRIYHEKMPNAGYTEIKRSSVVKEPEFSQPRSGNVSMLGTESRLYGAVNSFREPKPQRTNEYISDAMLAEMRRRREERQNQAIRRFEAEREAAAAALASYNYAAYGNVPYNNYGYGQNLYRNPLPQGGETDELPSRKYKFSHEGGIKKSLYAHMDTPVEIDVSEPAHRQYGSRAEVITAVGGEIEGSSKKKKDRDVDVDDDLLIAIPTYSQPKINYDPSAYRDMNLSEILFSDIPKSDKKSKKKKKKS